MFTKVRQIRAFESVIQQMEAAILHGRLSAGDRLPSERELQTLMNVSRNTLRESLRVLEQKGLVEIRTGHRGGIFVKQINADSMAESLGIFVQSQRITMEEISEFRQDLEGLMTRRAALRAGSKNMGELKRLLKEAANLAESGVAQWDEFMQVDKDIHLALARIAGNPVHHFFLETVHSNFHRYHITAYLPRDEETMRTTLAELKGIVTAVSRGDSEHAENLAREHVQRATMAMQQRSAAGGRALPTVRGPLKRLAPSSRMRKSGTGDHP